MNWQFGLLLSVQKKYVVRFGRPLSEQGAVDKPGATQTQSTSKSTQTLATENCIQLYSAIEVLAMCPRTQGYRKTNILTPY
jgi:hypothetical protein